MFILCKGNKLKLNLLQEKGPLPVGAPQKEEGRSLSCLSIFFLSFKNYMYVCMFEGMWVPLTTCRGQRTIWELCYFLLCEF